VNVLLVGLGRWGERHLRVLQQIGTTVWAADVVPARREWAVKHGVTPCRVVADYRAALGAVDAVDIVTPADSHGAIAATCLAARRHCFVEKPLTFTAVEGRRLVTAAARAERVLQVGHVFRFHPATRTLRDALAGGAVGAVRFATGRFTGFKRPRSDVGVTLTDAIHYFDLFAHLFERDATSVWALQRDYLGRGLDDMSVTVVNYGDIPALVEASYFVPGAHRECVIVGEQGSLIADYASATVTLHAGELRRTAVGWEAVDTGKESLPVDDAEPLRQELAAFVEACAGRRPNPVPGDAGVKALEIVEAAARSSTLGRVVELGEVTPKP
jgi:predicted dehydrogenase